jgi:hypothetical protein
MQDDALNHSSMEDDVWVPKFELNEEKMIIDLSPGGCKPNCVTAHD